MKTRLTSPSHAKTLLVLSSALPLSLSPNNIPAGQLRELAPSGAQPGPVVGLLLYAVGSVMKYEFTVTGNRRKNEKWFSNSYVL